MYVGEYCDYYDKLDIIITNPAMWSKKIILYPTRYVRLLYVKKEERIM